MAVPVDLVYARKQSVDPLQQVVIAARTRLDDGDACRRVGNEHRHKAVATACHERRDLVCDVEDASPSSCDHLELNGFHEPGA